MSAQTVSDTGVHWTLENMPSGHSLHGWQSTTDVQVSLLQ